MQCQSFLEKMVIKCKYTLRSTSIVVRERVSMYGLEVARFARMVWRRWPLSSVSCLCVCTGAECSVSCSLKKS